MTRRTIRFVAAGLAAAMAAIYFLIGANLLIVVDGQADDPAMAGFGASAGAMFLAWAILLWRVDRRWLWGIGAILQVAVAWAYVSVAPDRTPAFEMWGITLRIIQVPLFLALAWLTLRPREQQLAEKRQSTGYQVGAAGM